MKRFPLAFALASSLSLIVACGGGDDGPNPTLPDAGDGGDDPDAAVQRQCSIGASLGSPAGLTFSATVNDQMDDMMPGAVFVSIIAVLDAGPPIDAVNIQLWPGFGVFDPDIVVGTHNLTGVETDFYNCGACALLIGDFDTNTNMTGQDFVASAGSMDITMASTTIGETIEGTLNNVSFREVTFDDMAQMQTDVPDGCTTTIDTLPFSATLEAPPMMRLPRMQRRR